MAWPGSLPRRRAFIPPWPAETVAVAACLELVHSTRNRVRYRIRSSTALNWLQLQQDLGRQLAGLPLHWRINRAARSVLFHYRSPDDGLIDGPDTAANTLRQACQRLLALLSAAGATPEPAAVIPIHTRRRPTALLSPVVYLLNGLSAAASLSILLLASLLILLGIIGMTLPLTPGNLLLLLAYGLVELAMVLRRPFVATAAA